MRDDPESSVLRLSIPARPEYLVFTRLVLTGLSRSTEIDEETLADLKLAVTEICSPSVRGAGDGPGVPEIRLSYELSSDSLRVEVEETGHGVRDEAEEDAMGLAIASALVDELELVEVSSGSRIVLTKRLR